MSILVINAGSSTLKFGLFDEQLQEIARGLVDWTLTAPQADLVVSFPTGAPLRCKLEVPYHGSAVAQAVKALTQTDLIAKVHWPEVTAVGHRVVHGGTRFHQSVVIDELVKREIDRLSALAPLHNPWALAAITAAQEALPKARHVAVFDTAYYSNFPPEAYIYPVPYQWHSQWGVRRFGFHGISHQYIAGRAAQMLGRANKDLRLVSCHLGSGASATAVRAGEPVATSMGFTPLEGLMMGSRSGSVDPGILLYVMRTGGLSVQQVDDALNHESGLAGVSGISPDCRQIEMAAQKGDSRAILALQIYARIVRSTIGALAVTMGGMDALVFTAGIGENNAAMRGRICHGLQCLGAVLDEAKNLSARPDVDLAAADSPCRILAIATREELMIARETKQLARTSAN